MKIYRKANVFICESESLVRIAGFVSAGKVGAINAKAAAFFPFVFVRHKKYATPIFINHERIHFRQQIETLFVGLLLLTFLEKCYFKFFTKLTAEERYLATAAEQEAYRNQHDLQYLHKRKMFSVYRYI